MNIIACTKKYFSSEYIGHVHTHTRRGIRDDEEEATCVFHVNNTKTSTCMAWRNPKGREKLEKKKRKTSSYGREKLEKNRIGHKKVQFALNYNSCPFGSDTVRHIHTRTHTH